MLFTGNRLIVLDETPSTNTYALQLLLDQPPPPEGTVVQARTQTQGRGQGGNTWKAEAGQNLTLSIIYYPSFLEGNQHFALSKIVALAVRATVAEQLGEDKVCIKWANDVLIGRRKVAGILIENQWEGSTLRGSVIGIGLNVNQTDFPAELVNVATSLHRKAGHPFEVSRVYSCLLRHIEAYYLRLKAGDFQAIDAEYLQYLFGYGQEMPMILDNIVQSPRIMGLSENGGLCIQLANGETRTLGLKEAKFLL